MKKVLFTLLAIAGTQTLVMAQKVQTATIKTTIACDHCKTCGSCGARIEEALYKQKGIKRVDIDDKQMEIKVVYNTEKTTLDQIRNTIANNGFNADDVKAPAEALAKLDGCCRGEAE